MSVRNKNRKWRVIFNDDSDTLRRVPPPHTEEKIALAIDYLKDTQVDCLVWCIADQVAYSYPSEKAESCFKKLESMDSAYWPRSKDLMFSLYQKGIDYLPILIEKCRRSDLGFVASFRMNDLHLKSDPQGLLASKFWQTHQHLRLWEIIDGKTYCNAALDYTSSEVRNLYRTMIAEVISRYDVDGIELDFCRSPYFFQPSEAWAKRGILTDFVASIRQLMKKNGKGQLLIVRVPFGEARLKKAGIDLAAWLNKRLADVLVMSNLSNDYDLRIEPWRTLARKNRVLFYPSVEADPARYDRYSCELVSNPIAPAHNYVVPKTPEATVKRIRAMAQQFLSQNPDGIYLFNYPCILNERKNNRYKDRLTFRQLTEPLRQVGKIETLKGTAKQYTYWPELPISVETGRPPQYHQTIRFQLLDPDIRKAGTPVKLRFRQIACRNPHVGGKYRQNPILPAGVMQYSINGAPIEEELIVRQKQPGGRIPSGFTLKTHDLIEISLPAKRLVFGENCLAFEIPGFPKARDPYVFIYELEVEVGG